MEKMEVEESTEIKDEKDTKKGKKKRVMKFHRIKAHANPLADYSFDYAVSPDEVVWEKYFPHLKDLKGKKVEIADVGCGYGGLLDKLILGMEIRTKVVEYVQQRIEKLVKEQPAKYSNAGVALINAMKYLPNFFKKGQIFFLFPDPHFKKGNHRRRIISPQLLAEYAYALAVGGMAYTVTDVEDLHIWMTKHFTEHPLFERVSDKELENDPVVPLTLTSTDEAKKVERENGKKFISVFRRKPGTIL